MPTDDVDKWFESLPSDQTPILDALRKLVMSMGKDVAEEFKWGRPCYSTANGLFCYLHATQKHATLGFHRAGSLKDPKKLLEGAGKDMRHIKVASTSDIDAPAFKALLKQAMSA